MLEEAIPALWSAVNGFFTPTVLFILLNVVIGTIAVTSKSSPAPSAAAAGGGEAALAGADQQQTRRLSRVPSMAFERIRSFNLSRFTAPPPEPASADGVVDLGYHQPTALEPASAPVEKEDAAAECEREAAAAAAAAAEREREAQHAQVHVERTRSEARAVMELPRLPARLHKSASEKSAFSHFEAQEVEEAVRAVEKRRPATTMDGVARWLPVTAEPEDSESESEPEEEATGSEVDAEAENFINRFHNQLKLQRMESIFRYRENIRRGQAAAGV